MKEGQNIRVLVAEDDVLIQEVLNMKLDMLGIDVATVDDGYMVIEEILENEYDLILMDLQMPNLDGVETTRRIKEAFGEDGPMIVAVTGNQDSNIMQQCLNMGMDDYIAKPVNNDRLKEVIRICMERKS